MDSPANGQHCDPIVISRTHDAEDLVTILLSVEPNQDFFRGHFPRYPLLPGVVQIAWAEAGAKEHFAMHGSCKTLERLKFMGPIQPPIRVSLVLEKVDASVVKFHYRDDYKTYASGRLVYGL